MKVNKENVIKFMNENLYTLKSLENEYGISQTAIMNARKGKNCSVSTIKKLCKAFNCSPKDLIADE